MTPDPHAPPTGAELFNLAGYVPNDDEKLWSLIAHLSPIIGLSFIGPILALVIKGKDSKWVRAHAIESINFNLSCFILEMIGVVGSFFVVGLCLLLPVAAFNVVMGIIAAVKAWQGSAYRYPFTIRLLKD